MQVSVDRTIEQIFPHLSKNVTIILEIVITGKGPLHLGTGTSEYTREFTT